MKTETYKLASAVLLIMSSIALAFIQSITFGDIANGVLIYIAQAFLLAGALFGLDYYLDKITKISKNAVDKQDNSTLQ
jgi:hypothetical protein